MTTDSGLLNLMTSFAAVVKAGSFTKAAARLDLSKSVVSRHVSALEKALGVQLLYRSTHRLSLTEAGERFANHVVADAEFARDRNRGGGVESIVASRHRERERFYLVHVRAGTVAEHD